MPKPSRNTPRRLAAVLSLAALSPFCAEYLSGYQGVILKPFDLLIGIAIVGPLYGAVAVLIREVARRAGRGWPTMLLLSAAAGVVQAALIDQSLFNHHGFSGAQWSELATVIPGIDVDVLQLFTFVGGHVIFSFGAPIAVVEACSPRIAREPWLGRVGLPITVVLYLLWAAYFNFAFVIAPGFKAAPVQLIVAVAAVVALTLTAFALPRREPSPGRAVSPWLVGPVALALLATSQLSPETWTGVAIRVAAWAGLAALLLFWSRRAGWGRRHALAVAAAALLLQNGISYLVDPGDATQAQRWAASGAVTVALLALLAWGWWNSRSKGS